MLHWLDQRCKKNATIVRGHFFSDFDSSYTEGHAIIMGNHKTTRSQMFFCKATKRWKPLIGVLLTRKLIMSYILPPPPIKRPPKTKSTVHHCPRKVDFYFGDGCLVATIHDETGVKIKKVTCVSRCHTNERFWSVERTIASGRNCKAFTGLWVWVK